MRGGGGRVRGRGRGRGGGKVASFENPFSSQDASRGIKPEFSATHSDRPQPIFPTAVLRRFRAEPGAAAAAAWQQQLEDRFWIGDATAAANILENPALVAEADKDTTAKTAVGQARKRQGFTNSRLAEHYEFAARSALLPAAVEVAPAKRGKKSARAGRLGGASAAAAAARVQRRGRLPSMDSLQALEKKEGGDEEDEENEDGEAAPPIEEEVDEDEDDEDNDYVVDHYRDDDEDDGGGDEDGGGGDYS